MHTKDYWIKSIALDALVAAAISASVLTDSKMIMGAVLLLCWALTAGRLWAARTGEAWRTADRPAGFMLYHICSESVLVFTLFGTGHLLTALAYAFALAAFELSAHIQPEGASA